MSRLFKFCVIFLISTPAFAQQKTTSAIDRIAFSLGQCVSQAEQKTDELEALKVQLSALQNKLKELEDKKEK